MPKFIMNLIIACLLAPFLAEAQENYIRIFSSTEGDSIFTHSGTWVVYTIEEYYVVPEEDDEFESVIYNRSAAILFKSGSKKPLLLNSSLLVDTTEKQIIDRIKTPASVKSNPFANDSLLLGEVSDSRTIRHFLEGIFEVTESEYQYYPGAAHGSGHFTNSFYDATTETYFGFDDIFEAEIYPFLQQKLKEAVREEYPEWEFNDAEVDSIAAENYTIGPGEFLLEESAITIFCQMYETLFGWMQLGYNHFELTLGWEEVKPFMKKGNPLERTID